MEYTRQHTRGGASFSIKVELETPPTREETARLEHHLDVVINGFVSRYIKHVASWGEQKVALMKLDEREARLLGLLKPWKEANSTLGWGKRVRKSSAA